MLEYFFGVFPVFGQVFEIKANNLSILKEVPPNSRVIVNGGVYKGKIVIDKPLELIGKNYPIIDGQGEGHVVLVKAPCKISGFTLRNSGTNLLSEDSGIMVENVSGVFIEGNKIEDVLFGIYLKNSQGVVIKDNFISGKDLPLSMRGDGIRLWYSRSVTLENNTVVGVRDVVIWYSYDVLAKGNKVFHSRYGLHYMYSNGNILEGNEFIGNIVGAFIMFSRRILVKNNVFGSSKFLTGIGIGLKDASYIVITQNLIADNTIGIYLANSPEFTGEIINSDLEDSQVLEGVSYGNIIRKNVFAFNTKCMSFLPPAYPNLISENTFWANIFIAEYQGVSQDKNLWYSNFYDIYRGFDMNKDGYGDIPFEYSSLFLKVLADNPNLSFFYISPLKFFIEQLSLILPFFKPDPVFVDIRPSINPNFFGWEKIEPKNKNMFAERKMKLKDYKIEFFH